MMRYMRESLEDKDLVVNDRTMIPLGILHHETECRYRADTGKLVSLRQCCIRLHRRISRKAMPDT